MTSFSFPSGAAPKATSVRSLLQAAALLACQTLHAQALPSTPLEPGSRQAPPAGGQMRLGGQPGTAAATASPTPGTQVVLRDIEFTGNTLFEGASLRALLQTELGRAHDVSSLNALAQRVAGHYHQQGYPFASAFLPPQKLTEGVLRLEIVEGRFGRVYASGEFLPEDGAPFLAELRPGEVIDARRLERTMLLIDDLPNIDVSPYVRPGTSYGTGDLEAVITRQAKFGGEVGVDNVGNRFTGEYRLRAGLNIYSGWRFGDELRLKALKSQGGLTLGSADYEAPVGGSGWRAQAGVARTSYQLGQDYRYLDARGLADVYSARLGYPVLRTQARNLNVNLGVLYKTMEDRVELTQTRQRKHSASIPLTVVFDVRDALGGGGLTYGNVVFTAGQLWLDAVQRPVDAATARTQGGFAKTHLELARLQTLPLNFSVFGRLTAQYTPANLDASEKFSAGGIAGVRAYPSGQSVGDRGWLVQTELRHRFGDWTGFLLFDAGMATANAKPWDATSSSREHISGSGLGLRLERTLGWNLEAVLAERRTDRLPSDKGRSGARLMALATYRY